MSTKTFFKFVVLFNFLIIFVFRGGSAVFAETVIDTPSPTQSLTPTPSVTPTPSPSNDQKISDLQNQIKQYQEKIKELQGAKKTLSSQISIMDNQIRLTEFKIRAAEEKIEELQKDINVTERKIDDLESKISNSTEILLDRIEASYKAGKIQGWQIFLTSDSIGNFFTRLKYLEYVQIFDKRKIYASEQAKVSYANQQSILEDKQTEEEKLQKQLEVYTNQLNQEKTTKQQLLSVTQSDEEKYQKLLREARAQISAFKSFTSSLSGGEPSILPPQASPDGWYYNQRDERWGRNTIGSSSEQMWAVGCLVTATAMVRKQKGENVTPADVASNSSYFFSDTAWMLIPWNGGKFQSIWQQDLTAIDSRLLNGEPVIVGLRAGVYGQHFIVLKSGSNGNYIMNDPWHGANLNFSDHYSTSQIFQYGYFK